MSTNAPWHYVEHSWSDTGIYDSADRRIAMIDISGEATEDNQEVLESEAVEHARLIAAAPELLELAKNYASECGECDGLGFVVNYVDPFDRGDASSPERVQCDFCADIRAAIAKATGATP